MTQATEKKVAELTKVTRQHLPKAQKRDPDSAAFAQSAAKYYPALKKLADK